MNKMMYKLFYSIFYLFSLLPWRVMYFISDAIAFLLRVVVKYRLEVVDQNLAIAFPNKSIKERTKIKKDFYQQFTDSFIETIKMISMSEKEFEKRFSSNVEVLNKLFETGQSVQLMAGHFFNWEFANWGASKYGKYPFIAVYMPLENKAFNKLIYDLRARYGSLMVPATNFRTQFHKYSSQGPYAIALAADQNPANPLQAYWISFFGKLTPFLKGPEKGAKLNNTAQVFAHFYRTKRGYYHLEYEVMTISPNYFNDGQLTVMFAKILEEKIKMQPANYLWSHRRWKYTYDAAVHQQLLVK
jgi:KDO2-lipid IV(A) lauroyltransferase